MKIIRVCPDAMNNICGVMDTLLTSSAVDRAIKAWSGQTKDYKISKHRANKLSWIFLNLVLGHWNG
jgi:hypothetical protein